MAVQHELDEERHKTMAMQHQMDELKDGSMKLQQGYDIAIAGHTQLKNDFTALQYECQLQSRKDRQQSVIWDYLGLWQSLWLQFQDTALSLNPSPNCPISHLP